LRIDVGQVAEREGDLYTVALWCYRHFVEGFHTSLPADLTTARDDALTMVALIEQDGGRPARTQPYAQAPECTLLLR
jgi:hypothetical protein